MSKIYNVYSIKSSTSRFADTPQHQVCDRTKLYINAQSVIPYQHESFFSYTLDQYDNKLSAIHYFDFVAELSNVS
jgi:hypothetical protein